MKKALFLLGTLLAVSGGVTAQTAAPAEPTGVVTALCKAFENEDANAMMALTTDDFAIVSFDGQTADRDLLSQALSGGFLVTDTLPVNNLGSRTYNGNTAIVTGTSKFKGSLQGTQFSANVVFTATCVKMPTGWKIAGFQLSGRPDAK